MARIFLSSSLSNLTPAQLLPVLESVLQQLEDQVNAGTNVVGLDATNQTLPQGMRLRDIVVNLQHGELNIGMFNGKEVVYASFGSFTGAITDQQHGTRSGGTLHDIATTSLAGFMSAADKTKSDHYLGDTSAANAASLTEYPNDGDWGFHTDTVGVTYKLAKNKGGTIYTTALT